MRTRTAVALLCCVLLAAAAGAGIAAAGTPGATGPSDVAAQDAGADADADPAPAAQYGDNFTRPLTIEINVQQNGDARFVLRKEYPTATPAQEDAFRELAGEFRDGEYHLGYETFQRVVDDVSEHTNRSMEVGDARRTAWIDGDTGKLEQQFTWTNFGNASDDRVVVGDAFTDDEGVWLRDLDQHERLELRGPEEYRISDSQYGVSGDAVVWEGPHEFQADEFRTVFERDGGPLANLWLLLAGVGLVIVGGVAYLLVRRLELDGFRDVVPTTVTGDGGTPTPEQTGTDGGSTAPEVGAVGGATAPIGDSESEDAADDGVDPELLSDEERVERLLEQNGGRMKQANIVDETGWSNAKVSQLLSDMDEQDRVDKLRIGRENLISLPDEDVTATE